jgi:hypothetical protein
MASFTIRNISKKESQFAQVNHSLPRDTVRGQGHAPTPITSTGKRGLSRKTLSAITPNYNPNYIAPAPGHTPQSVHANRSPSSKRTRHANSLTPETNGASSIPRPCLKVHHLDDDMSEPAGSPGDAPPPLPLCLSPARPRGHRKTGKELRSSLMAVDPCRLSMDPDGNIRLEGAHSLQHFLHHLSKAGILVTT